MTRLATTLLLLAGMTATGLVCFILGARSATLATSDFIGRDRINVSLEKATDAVEALHKNDLAFSRERHRRDLESALQALSVTLVPEGVTCRDEDRQMLASAAAVLANQPESLRLRPEALQRALQFCDHR